MKIESALNNVDQLREILENLKLYASIISTAHGEHYIALRTLGVDRTPKNQLSLFPYQTNSRIGKRYVNPMYYEITF